MEASPRKSINKHGVSIIACTNRRNYMQNLIKNYTRQHHPKKELIIVVNNDSIPLEPYQRLSKKLRSVRVFRIPGATSLGACLNFAVKKAKYSYIAKFDDDDYYAPYYLTDILQAALKTKADVIGKRAHYIYLQGSKTLLLRFPQDENKPVAKLPGATLLIKKQVLSSVQFPDRNVGEDDLFCAKSKKKGYKVYSAGRHNFVAIRRKNSLHHTWIISDQALMSHHKKIPNVKNYKKYVQKKPKGVL